MTQGASSVPDARRLTVLAGFSLLCALTWYFNIRGLDLRIAESGWSPIDWVYETYLPRNFEKNFPSGIASYQYSAFMHVYALAYSLLGIAPEVLIYGVVGFEIVLLAYGVWRLSRALLPESPAIAHLMTVAVVVASHADALDLSRFGAARFWGLYYAVANGLRLLAIAAALEKRFVVAALLIAGCFITHPIEGLIGVLFIAAIYATSLGEILGWRTYLAAAVFLVTAGAWFSQLLGVGLSGGGIPTEDWFSITRAFSFHWYPIYYGIFGIEHQERFVPFLAFAMLVAYYFYRVRDFGPTEKKILPALLVMLGLTTFGVLASWLVSTPFIAKLALHRASLLFALVGIVYVVNGLWGEMRDRSAWRPALALGLIVSTFILKPGFPLLLVLLLTFPAWKDALRGGSGRAKLLGGRIVGAVALTSLALLLFYAHKGWIGEPTSPAYTGGKWILLFTLTVFVVLALPSWTARTRLVASRESIITFGAVGAIGLSALASLAYPTFIRKNDFPALDYKSTQLWARENTDATALFMVDPTISYGWRDYSRRSSFGNLREWLFTTWLYDSRLERYQQGMARFKEFDLDLNSYLAESRPPYGSHHLSEAVGDRFYSSSCEWRASLARRYHIDYFVFRAAPGPLRQCFPIAYRNAGFLVERVGF